MTNNYNSLDRQTLKALLEDFNSRIDKTMQSLDYEMQFVYEDDMIHLQNEIERIIHRIDGQSIQEELLHDNKYNY